MFTHLLSDDLTILLTDHRCLLICFFLILSFQVIDGYCRAVTLWPNDTVKTAFGIGLMFVQFFIPVMVLIICYGQIIWVLTTRINTDLMKNKSQMDNSDNICGQRDNTKAIDLGKEKFQLARRNAIKNFTHCWTMLLLSAGHRTRSSTSCTIVAMIYNSTVFISTLLFYCFL